MPTYKYRREDGTTFTIRQKITADALEECPETGQKVERVITGGMGFQLKGGGWYEGGYASTDASEGEANDSDDGDGEDTGAGDDNSQATTSGAASGQSPTSSA